MPVVLAVGEDGRVDLVAVAVHALVARAREREHRTAAKFVRIGVGDAAVPAGTALP